MLVAAPVLAGESVSVTAYNLALAPYALVVDAGTERGFYTANGLEPRWVTREKRAVSIKDLPELLQQGTELGLSSPSEILVARVQGLPVKVIAGFVGETEVKIYVSPNGRVKEPRDLDGKTIGPTSLAVQRGVGYFSRAYGIKAQAAPFGTLDGMVAALRNGEVDAIITAEARVLAFVDQGELRLLVRSADYRPQPELNNALWASDSLIALRPELVRAFVKATLQTVRYLKDNPADAARLMAKRTGMSEALSRKAVAQIDWVPSGKPGGDLAKAAQNYWRVLQGTGALPPNIDLGANELIDTRFVQ